MSKTVKEMRVELEVESGETLDHWTDAQVESTYSDIMENDQCDGFESGVQLGYCLVAYRG